MQGLIPRTIVIICLVAQLSGCATSGNVSAFKASKEIDHITEEEQRLWHESQDFDKNLKLSGRVYPDKYTTDYLQNIMDTLYPEFEGRIKVKILNDPHLNAFALPNGSIYIHLGLLSRFENEAQLATVLAHEGAHFIDKHGLRSRRSTKGASAFALATIVVGVPIVGLAAVSSIYGYSQELENDADRIGYERLVKAGYSAQESVKTFEHLAAEVNALEIDEPYFFSTHPKLQERIDNYSELNKKSAVDGRIAASEYQQKTREVRIDSLQADLSMHRYKSIIVALDDKTRQTQYPPEAFYYLGEAFRLRNDDTDTKQALASYQTALDAAPDFAPTHRALGLYYMKQGQDDDAKKFFANYMRLAPEAKDIAFIRNYYNTLEHRGNTQ